MKTMSAHLVIADDHPVFREGLRKVLAGHSFVSTIDEAGDGREALALIREKKPDLAILDIGMPGLDGLEVVHSLREGGDLVSVIILTMYDDQEIFDEALNLGVRGYVSKENAPGEIVDAVKAVLAGKPYFSATMSQAMLNRSSRARNLQKNLPALNELTDVERQILCLIADGKTSREIAAELFVSAKTIDNHRTDIAAKLNIRGTHSLVKFALRHRSEL